MLFLISGPSGVGKSTLIKAVMEQHPDIRQVVSCTTRKPRANETEGVHYHFISKEDFLSKEKQGLFLTHAEIYGNYYGVLTKDVEELLKTSPVILDLHPTWMQRVKQKIAECRSIYIMPPDPASLQARLSKRDGDSENILKRLKEATFLEKFAIEYDHIIINSQDKMEDATRELSELLMNNANRKATSSPRMMALTTTVFKDNNIIEPYTVVESMRAAFPTFPNEDVKAMEVIGWSNVSFRLTISQDDYVLRIPRPNAGHVSHYFSEQLNSLQAFSAMLAPKTVYFDTNSGIKLTSFVKNEGTLTVDVIKNNPNFINLVAEKLSVLHSLAQPFANKADPKTDMLTLFKLLPQTVLETYQQLEQFKNRCLKSFDLLDKAATSSVSCHMDPTPYNILIKGPNDIELIDWEHSGQFDFCWDLANFSTQADLSPEMEMQLLTEYRRNIQKRIPLEERSELLDEKLMSVKTRMNLYKPLIQCSLCIFILYQKHVVLNKTVTEEQLDFYANLRYNKTLELFEAKDYIEAWQTFADKQSVSQLTKANNKIDYVEDNAPQQAKISDFEF